MKTASNSATTILRKSTAVSFRRATSAFFMAMWTEIWKMSSRCSIHPSIPGTYQGHSLSVSDVIEVVGENEKGITPGSYFTDSFGFKSIDFDSSRCAEMDGVRMLMIQPHKTPVVTYVKQDLSSLQRAVSDHCEEAFIEYTYPFDDDCMILGNEEAKLCGMEGNRRLFGSVYAGPIFITRDNGEGDLCALTDEQVKTYGEMFAVPEDISPSEVQRDVGFTFYGWG